MSDIKKKVLVVEDDPVTSKVYQEALLENGYEVETIFDGGEAFAKIKEFNPNLIILDLILPKKNGIDILKEIRADEDAKATPVVVLTNLENDEMVANAMELGCKGYLIKSNYELKEVMEKINEALK